MISTGFAGDEDEYFSQDAECECRTCGDYAMRKRDFADLECPTCNKWTDEERQRAENF